MQVYQSVVISVAVVVHSQLERDGVKSKASSAKRISHQMFLVCFDESWKEIPAQKHYTCGILKRATRL